MTLPTHVSKRHAWHFCNTLSLSNKCGTLMQIPTVILLLFSDTQPLCSLFTNTCKHLGLSRWLSDVMETMNALGSAVSPGIEGVKYKAGVAAQCQCVFPSGCNTDNTNWFCFTTETTHVPSCLAAAAQYYLDKPCRRLQQT